MATISALRDALEVRLATIPGLRTFDTWPSTFNTPGAIVKPAGVGKDAVFGGEQLDAFEITVAVEMAGPGLERAQDDLDAYISRSGASSVQAAIEGDQSLGGTAQFVLWRGWDIYDGLSINGIEYL